jgi:hypothetical protein
VSLKDQKMSNKIHSKIILDANESLASSSSKYLDDFKTYIDSKKCYSSGPLNQAEIRNVEAKIVYQCKMKILMEERGLSWSQKPTKQRLSRSVKPTFDVWNDYQFQLPLPSDKRSEQKRPLPEHDYTTDCEACEGQGSIKCSNHRCNNDNETCLACNKGYKSDGSRCVQCRDGLVQYQICHGRGRLGCSKCASCGVFHHTAISWETRISTWYYQNSFLPEEIIAQADKIPLWSKSETLWTKDSSIENFLQSLDESHSTIPLKTNIIKDYKEKHPNETLTLRNQMRRFLCDIERLDFQEVEYILSLKYLNPHDSTRGKFSLKESEDCSLTVSRH